jgi:hypothetical protein
MPPHRSTLRANCRSQDDLAGVQTVASSLQVDAFGRPQGDSSSRKAALSPSKVTVSASKVTVLAQMARNPVTSVNTPA